MCKSMDFGGNSPKYPLSQEQLGIYFEAIQHPEWTNYNLAMDVRFSRGIDTERLQQAILQVVAAYPLLRTRFCEENGEPRQYTDPSLEIEVPVECLADAAVEARIEAFVRPFDLSRGPLVRFLLLETPTALWLVQDMHHILCDGTSATLFNRLLELAYSGQPLPEEAMSFYEYAQKAQQKRQQQEYQTAAAYYRERFAGAEGTVLPEQLSSDAGAYSQVELPVDKAAIQQFCAAHHFSAIWLFMSAFELAASRLAREDTVVYASSYHGRANPAVKATLGMFVQTLPLLVKLPADMPVLDFIRGHKENFFAAVKHTVYSFSDFVSELQIRPELSFSYQGGAIQDEQLLLGENVYQNRRILGKACIGLQTFVYDFSDQYRLRIRFTDSQYTERFVQSFAEAVRSCLENMMVAPSAVLSEMSLVSAQAGTALLELGTGETRSYEPATMVDLFQAQAAQSPALTAVVDEVSSLTYAELDQASDALAAELLAQGLQPEDFIAVMLPRRKEFLVSTLAVFKAGGAYIPFDDEYPIERLQYMLDDSGAQVLITTHGLFEQKNSQGGFHTAHIIFLDEFDFTRAAAPVNRSRPEGLAYMIYTSGSTGRPKGVMVEHRGLHSLMLWKVWQENLQSGTHCAEQPSFSFDASVPDLYAPLICGAELHVLSAELCRDLGGMQRYFTAHAIEGLAMPTQLGMELLKQYPDLPLRFLMLGGEKLQITGNGSVNLYNCYGPTEFTVEAASYLVDSQRSYSSIPIGRPVPNSMAAVVDRAGRLVPRGTVGELCLLGPQMARGYWKRPEKTAEAFVRCPFRPGERMYCTGDLVRWNEDGELEYIGRIDKQVKLRGFRIELGEIESMLMGFPGIQGAVAAVQDINGTQQLCAYYTAEESVDEPGLKEYLGQSLTAYMVPNIYMRLDSLPLTPNGKVDRRALPVPELRAEAIIAPETDRERALFAIAAAQLKTEDFGVTTNLISMGLTSLGAIRLSAAIGQQLGLTLTMKNILQRPYIREWTGLLQQEAKDLHAYPKQAVYPLTENQLGIYIDWEQKRESLQYNVPMAWKLTGADPERIKTALTQILAAHPYLKVHFALRGGKVVQLRRDEAAAEVRLERLDQEPEAAFFQSRVRPFNLLGDALYRMEIYAAPAHTYLFIDIHHSIYDGGSVNILLQELAQAYGGEALQQETFSAYDYALAHQEWKASPAYEETEAYFDSLVEGAESALYPVSEDKPADEGRAQVSAAVPGEAVRSLCQSQSITASSFFTAAFMQVLHRILREEKLLITTISNGRSSAAMARTLGMFVQTLPVVSRAKKQTVGEAVQEMHAQLLATIERDQYPFTQLVERHGIKPNILFAYQGGVVSEGSAAAYTAEDIPLQLDTAKTPLMLQVMPQGDTYELRFEYDSSLYAAQDIECLSRACVCLVQALAQAAPEQSTAELPLVTQEEAQALQLLGQGERLIYDQKETIVDILRRQAAERPDDTAVVYENRSYTYRQIDAMTTRLAIHLQKLGVVRETAVGVMIDRSEWMLLYPLAVMKAGGTYMPLDYSFPEERLHYMLEDAGVELILSEADRVESALPGFRGTVLKTQEVLALPETDEVLTVEPAPQDRYVILYTSGSTGRPKGCMLEHHSLVNFCCWYVRAFDMTAADRSLAYANFGFDAHMMDIYPSLVCGGTVYIIPGELRLNMQAIHDYIGKNKITIAFLTTQIGVQLSLFFPHTSLRLLSVGGEKLMPIKKPDYRFFNGYGPTECTIYSTVYEVKQDYDTERIGRPLANCQLYVLDADRQLTPRGIAGELYIAGEGVGRGYLNLPEVTAEKFVMIEGKRMYRTGDLVRWMEDGNLQFLGRIDKQVKLRGFRIELGEIESVLASFPGLQSGAAAVQEVGGTQQLCAYYTAQEHLDEDKLREHLAQSLTSYMVPSIYLQLESLPLTPNGKLDRRALPVPELKAQQIIAPETDTEQALFAVTARQLKTEAFGVTTNLISMGLTSIGAIRLSLAIQQELGWTLRTKDILQTPQIRAWTGLLEQESEKIQTYEKQECYPLTENQLGIYIDWEQQRESLQYNVPMAWKLTGAEPERLRDALTQILAAHPYLKVRFALRGGKVVQLRRDEAAAEVRLERLDQEPETAFFQSRVRPFDLLAENLYRMEVYAAPQHTYLFIDIHHIIYDGGSMRILQQALSDAYNGKSLRAEAFSAYDYALAYQEWKKSAAYDEAQAYFDKLLAGVESVLYPTAADRHGAAGSGQQICAVAGEAIRAFCRRQGITPSSFFTTVMTQVLHRITREKKLLITTVSNGRSSAAMADTAGMFVQTLPVVSEQQPEQTAAAAAQAMHAQMLAAVEREKYPFTQMVERCGIQANILIAYQGDVLGGNLSAPYAVENISLQLDTVKVPLSLNILPTGDAYRLVFEYDSALYADCDMESLSRAVAVFAANLAQAKDAQKLLAVPMLSAAEQQELLALGTGEVLDYDEKETIVDLFQRQAGLRPQATAITDEVSSITYGALDRVSNALAADLVRLGLGPDCFAAVMLPRRKEFLAATLAVFKAGGAYIPFDDEYPTERLQYMLDDSGAQVLITTHRLFEQKNAEGDFHTAHILFLDDFDFARAAAPVNQSRPERLAYMIYTSGSTGRPKGVMVEHRSLANLVHWVVRREALQPGTRCAEQPSFSFDASLPDLYPPLTCGAELHVLSSELRKDLGGMHAYFTAQEIEVLTLPTQLGMELLNQYADLPLRYMMVGGEKLQPTRYAIRELYNGYGPTEFTVCSSYHMVDAASSAADIPIGRPVPNSLSAVVDAAGQLVPRGMAGELCLLGRQMARGYWNRPEKTAEVFVDCPFLPGERMYRTGDLVRWNEAGELEYIGRIDKQVKLRGFRIELGEIENALAACPGIDSAVVAVQELSGSQQLCAYYTAGAAIDEAVLKDKLSQSLTAYMVPGIYMQLDSLPLTPNGKVDRRALPVPEMKSLFAYEAPANALEEQICAVYREVLQRDRVGALDDFFALGGTSLRAMRVIISLANAGCRLSYGDMFKYKTPRAIAAFVQVGGEESAAAQAHFDLAHYDYSAIDQLLTAPEPDLWHGFALRPYGRILLTGATGYLGIHLLHYLLMHTDSEICCLVRAKKDVPAVERLRGMMVYYFAREWEEAFDARVRVIDGDITDDLTIRLQAEHIDTVFNCAAIVKHYAAGDIMDRVNIEGVRQLIELCAARQALLVQTSTYSIGGEIEADRPHTLTEHALYIGQQTDNEYLRTKFLAERLVLQAMADGRITAKIMRMGNLMGRESDGEFQLNMKNNAFAMALKSFKVLGMIPLAQMNTAIEISPIDRSAEAVALLAQTPAAMTVFHTYNNYQVNMALIVKAFNDYGYPISVVSQPEFAAHTEELMHDPEKAMYLQGLLHNGKIKEGMTSVQAVNAYTAKILYRLGFYWTPTHGSYMREFIEMLDGLGFFEEN